MTTKFSLIVVTNIREPYNDITLILWPAVKANSPQAAAATWPFSSGTHSIKNGQR